jgi:fucose permease
MIKVSNNKLIERIKYSFSKKGPLRRDYDEKTTFNKEASFIINYLFAGFNDATAGAILPAVQKKYHLSFTLVSTLFVCNLIGWIAAAILTPEILKYLTVGRAICLLNAIAIIPATVIAAGSPFPVMAIKCMDVCATI